MTRAEAEETLWNASAYLEPRANLWLNSDQPDEESYIWDAYFMLRQRATEMMEYDNRPRGYDE